MVIRTQKTKTSDEKTTPPVKNAPGPLFEGIRKKRPNGFFQLMNDDEIINYAKGIITALGIKGRKELHGKDAGLYQVLWDWGLLDKTGLPRKIGEYASLSDEQLVEYALKFRKDNNITTRIQMIRIKEGLYRSLLKRGLLDIVFNEF